MHEAADLQRDLRRAEIEPTAWVINQSLAPLSVSDPVLVARQGQERRYIDEVVREHANEAYMVPWSADVLAHRNAGETGARESSAA